MVRSSTVRRWLFCCVMMWSLPVALELTGVHPVADAASKKSKKDSDSSKSSKSSSKSSDSSKSSKSSKSSSKSSDSSKSSKSSSKSSRSSKSSKSSSKSSKSSRRSRSSRRSKHSHERGTAREHVVIESSSTKGSPPIEIVLPTRKADASLANIATRAGIPRNPRVVSHQVRDLAPLPIDALYATREIGDYDWTPDGKRLIVVTNLSGKANLWAVDVNGPGWPQQLTFSDDSATMPRVSPNGKWVLYASDPANEERRDLFLVPLAGGTPVNLTHSPRSDELVGEWSPDGTQIAYLSDEDTSGIYQVMVADLGGDDHLGPARRVSRSVLSSTRPHWSPDGSSILVSRFSTPSDSSLVSIDLKGGQETVLTPHQGEQTWLGVGWSNDGSRVLGSSDASGAANVAVIDVASRDVTWVTKVTGEAVAQSWSPTEDRVAWITNNSGNLQIHAAQPQESPRGSALRIRKGQIDDARFSPDGRYLAFRYAGPTRASDLWVYDLGRNAAHQVTFSMVSGIRPEHLIEPLLINYASFDGRFISGFLYVPHNLDADARRPAVVWVHPGPGKQVQNGFDPSIQYLVNHGYVVLAPNYRGSSGFGREFENLDNMDWGGGDVQDLVQAAEFLKTQSYIDPARIAVLGRGFGGYLSLMAMCKSPEMWAAGVDVSGPSDLTRYYNMARKELQAVLKQEMGSPEEKQALWLSRSPNEFLPNIRSPLLVVQGAKDLRVSEKDTRKMVETLQGLHLEVEYQVYPDEGAQFVGRQNQADMFRRVVDFLDRHLPEPKVAGPAVSGGEGGSVGTSSPASSAAGPVAAPEAAEPPGQQ